MIKKTKFYVGMTLIVQAATLLVTFIAMCVSKKSKWAVLAVAVLSAGAGIFITTRLLRELTDEPDIMSALNDLYINDDLDRVNKRRTGSVRTSDIDGDVDDSEDGD